MSIIQSILLLVCIGLVIFSRGAATGYLEMPAFQNMITRSQGTFRLPFESPTRSARSTRPSSSWEQGEFVSPGHRHQGSDDLMDMMHSPTLEFSPPTPTSIGTPEGEAEEMNGNSAARPSDSLETPALPVRRSASEPGELRRQHASDDDIARRDQSECAKVHSTEISPANNRSGMIEGSV